MSELLIESEVTKRLQKYAREWAVDVQRTIETESSLIAFGTYKSQPVILKVIKQRGDEWRSGDVLQAFDGRGVVRVYEQASGAVLLEQLQPGTPLVELVVSGKDEEATDILACVIQQMSNLEDTRHLAPGTRNLSPETRHPTPGTRYPLPTVHDWARGFDRYINSSDEQIPRDLVETAHETYLRLAATQRQRRLLHGDLQHYNVLFDSERGWVAIDPKGVTGELEYEIGAAMRNPIERPDLFLSRNTIERRLKQFTNKLSLDYNRAVGWTFAQAVLSAVWTVEDGFELVPLDSSLRLAKAILPMLEMT